jgi:hypothetical protein
MDKLHIGANTIEAYITAGVLYLSPGMMGLYDGSQDWNVTNSAAFAPSLLGLTVSCWASVEISVVAGVPVITPTSIGGATDPKTIPASFTGSYDGTKGGHYITGTKRCHSLVWLNAAGVPEGVINSIGGHDGYVGYGQSDDANDYIYCFLKLMNQETDRVFRPGLTMNTPFITAGVITSSAKISSTLALESPMAIFEDQKAQNTAGGTFTSGANRTRDLNTTVVNSITGCSIAANQITLPAGKYYILWSAPGYGCGANQTLLYNITGSAELKRGAVVQSLTSDSGNLSTGEYILTNAAPMVIELRHVCTTTRATVGFGLQGNFGIEVYSRVTIFKLT